MEQQSEEHSIKEISIKEDAVGFLAEDDVIEDQNEEYDDLVDEDIEEEEEESEEEEEIEEEEEGIEEEEEESDDEWVVEEEESPEDCLNNKDKVRITFTLVTALMTEHLKRKRAYHHWGLVAKFHDGQDTYSVLFELTVRRGKVEKSISFYDDDEDRWVFTEKLGWVLMRPFDLLLAYQQHPMEGCAYDRVKNNCQKWVRLFLLKVARKLERNLPDQFRDTVLGKFDSLLFSR